MEAWKIILISVGGNAALLAAVAFFSKTLVRHLLDKDIETFKKSIELKAFEHQIVFSRVHEKKVEILSNIYVAFKEVFFKAQDFSSIITFKGEPSQDQKRKALAEAAQSFGNLFEKHKIWLPSELSDKIEHSFKELIKPVKDFIFADFVSRDDPSYLRDKYQKWVLAHEQYNKEVPAIILDLENEFRREIGVTKS